MAAALNLFGVGDLKSKQPEIEQAILQLRESFPFPKYLESTEDSRRSVAQTVVKHLPAGSTILDFGCGPLDKIAVLQSLGYRCTGYDDLGDYNYRAGNNVEKIFSFAALTGVELRRSVPTEAESYDLVMLNDVIEHLHDSPRELLNDLVILIKPGGYLLITVPNLANIRKRVDLLRGRTNLARFTSFYWWPGPWRGHVREYVREDLESLARFLGLHLVELKSCHHMIYLLPAAARPAYRAVTCLFPGWRDSWLLLAQKACGWAPRRNLPPEQREAVVREMGKLSSWEDAISVTVDGMAESENVFHAR